MTEDPFSDVTPVDALAIGHDVKVDPDVMEALRRRIEIDCREARRKAELVALENQKNAEVMRSVLERFGMNAEKFASDTEVDRLLSRQSPPHPPPMLHKLETFDIPHNPDRGYPYDWAWSDKGCWGPYTFCEYITRGADDRIRNERLRTGSALGTTLNSAGPTASAWSTGGVGFWVHSGRGGMLRLHIQSSIWGICSAYSYGFGGVWVHAMLTGRIWGPDSSGGWTLTEADNMLYWQDVSWVQNRQDFGGYGRSVRTVDVTRRVFPETWYIVDALFVQRAGATGLAQGGNSVGMLVDLFRWSVE